jgi:hypothetical protein
MSAGASWSKGFHERAISRALARSLSISGGGLIGISNSTTAMCKNLHQLLESALSALQAMLAVERGKAIDLPNPLIKSVD